MSTSEPSYSAIRRLRREAPERFTDYPVIADRDAWIARQAMAAGTRVLEIGAGDRPFEHDLRRAGFTGVFKTMDVDRDVVCDYDSVESIDESFDAVIMREVIEHLPRQTFYEYVERIQKLLTPAGRLILTTPNPWAPGWVYSDYTHQSPWPPADLYAVLRWYGFTSVEIVRIVWPSRLLWLKRLYWAVHSRLYDIDYAGSYAAVAQR